MQIKLVQKIQGETELERSPGVAPCPCRALPRVAALLQGAASRPQGVGVGGTLCATGTLWGWGDVGTGECGDVGARLGSPKSIPLLCTPPACCHHGAGPGELAPCTWPAGASRREETSRDNLKVKISAWSSAWDRKLCPVTDHGSGQMEMPPIATIYVLTPRMLSKPYLKELDLYG